MITLRISIPGLGPPRHRLQNIWLPGGSVTPSGDTKETPRIKATTWARVLRVRWVNNCRRPLGEYYDVVPARGRDCELETMARPGSHISHGAAPSYKGFDLEAKKRMNSLRSCFYSAIHIGTTDSLQQGGRIISTSIMPIDIASR